MGEDHWRLFRPCRWINSPFTCLRVLEEGEVAVAASETEDGCVPGGVVVSGEVGSGGVRCHHHIRLVQRSGGYAVIAFACQPKPRGQHILLLVEV